MWYSLRRIGEIEPRDNGANEMDIAYVIRAHDGKYIKAFMDIDEAMAYVDSLPKQALAYIQVEPVSEAKESVY